MLRCSIDRLNFLAKVSPQEAADKEFHSHKTGSVGGLFFFTVQLQINQTAQIWLPSMAAILLDSIIDLPEKALRIQAQSSKEIFTFLSFLRLVVQTPSDLTCHLQL